MDRAWAQEQGVSAIYLHGSRALERPGPDSDYDIAVLLQSPPKDWQESETLRCEIEVRVAKMLRVAPDELDVVFLHEAPPAFCYRAIRTGRILWEADNHHRVHFEARLMNEYLDDLYFEEIHNRAMRQRLKEGTFGYRPAPGQ